MSKAIADKIDIGMHMLAVTNEDLKKLEEVLALNTFEVPKIKLAIYKNRSGKWKNIYLWCRADMGVCRMEPMFCTTFDYDLVSMDDIRIKIQKEDESAF